MLKPYLKSGTPAICLITPEPDRGEKIIQCDERGMVDNFYLNSKCAAGTGAFLSEVAERAEIDLSSLSELAAQSDFNRELNSFCTVFAKTEIMGWLFEDMPQEDMARGIYLSMLNRVLKLRIDSTVPVFLIGGVASHHPFFNQLLSEKMGQEIRTPKNSEFIVSFGAALMAMKHHQQRKSKIE